MCTASTKSRLRAGQSDSFEIIVMIYPQFCIQKTVMILSSFWPTLRDFGETEAPIAAHKTTFTVGTALLTIARVVVGERRTGPPFGRPSVRRWAGTHSHRVFTSVFASSGTAVSHISGRFGVKIVEFTYLIGHFDGVKELENGNGRAAQARAVKRWQR